MRFKSFSQINLTHFLIIFTTLLFLGRAYQAFFWDLPLRSFFWDESLLKAPVELLTNMTWREYVTSPLIEKFTIAISFVMGATLLIAAINNLTFIFSKDKKWYYNKLNLAAFVVLFCISLLSAKDKFWRMGQLIEYSIQFGSPLAVYYLIKLNEQIDSKLLAYLKIISGFTFIGHGLYALGFYPVPGYFIDMTINILGTTEDQSIIILYLAGILDIIFAIAIFLPKIEKYALCYGVFWGFATAIARLWANFYTDFMFNSFSQWTFEVLVRLPHGAVPLFLLIYLLKSNKRKISAANERSKTTSTKIELSPSA
ncbi:hypothetical protein [Aureibacter tunicatorum]|uniref:Membrane protein n=1 Tax=Aureibacter tunicatorum TaxID=866807 RepID=A0AAE4BSH1_9BACT|nr:hypothetical protein [Aureibacter tunicatorum]MDR6238855.1 putative membrane protein [Aureibacter tunicatorum]BDD05218.1 hypothetical protein AUTU_27010 [Aureibacter tunicatorum]